MQIVCFNQCPYLAVLVLIYFDYIYTWLFVREYQQTLKDKIVDFSYTFLLKVIKSVSIACLLLVKKVTKSDKFLQK